MLSWSQLTHWAVLPSRCACLIFQLIFCVTKSQPRVPFSESIKNEVSLGVQMVRGVASGSERGLQGSLQVRVALSSVPFLILRFPCLYLHIRVLGHPGLFTDCWFQCRGAVHFLGSASKGLLLTLMSSCLTPDLNCCSRHSGVKVPSGMLSEELSSKMSVERKD